MEDSPKVLKVTLFLAIMMVGVMGLVYAYDVIFDLNLYRLGILPRTWSGLAGIFTSPFIHSTNGYSHLFNNSVPMFVLTWLLFYNYRNIAPKVFIIIFIGTGLLVWGFGRPNYHIGMSGVIYGLTSFLMLTGFLTKHLRVAAISLLVIFLYGSLIWGIFPIDPKISFEGHAFGFLIGAILAIVYRNQLPQPDKFRYEIEEELGIEMEDHELWKIPETGEVPTMQSPNHASQSSSDPLQIIYTFKPLGGSEAKNLDKEDKPQ